MPRRSPCILLRVNLLLALLGAGLFLWWAGRATLLAPTPAAAAALRSGAIRDHAAWLARWTALLQRHVNPAGRVDYAALRRAPAELELLYAWIAEHSPDAQPGLFPTASARLAYWLNAYNLAALTGIVRHYPVGSVRDIRPVSGLSLLPGGGFFMAQRFVFGGERWRLYTLEHRLIRRRFAEARLHFALNCGSVGCPELPREAFTPDGLEAQLARETRKFLADPRHLQIDTAGATLRLSALFKWYQDDFLRAAPTLLDFVLPHLDAAPRAQLAAARERLTVTFLPYDWSLNDQAPAP